MLAHALLDPPREDRDEPQAIADFTSRESQLLQRSLGRIRGETTSRHGILKVD
ncbi:hypothetical protein D187_006763 [Cystobacter fuscus DSM 2262]|uniref:Uncharacterized protein n=1 Tax=Cystobacter fuscus (strain ATCC 25194 / DSM 2262 / NBRC 100088 / M29) TaxID=1242864 RepID=S9Q6Q6_CYSF2|nr:hypothetical protein D187_006763 [Cystobacter fuscus DSM 2262]